MNVLIILQIKNGTKHNITKNADLRKKFETEKAEGKLIHNNPILSAVIKNHLQSYDPRSPTQDFERTPIIITSKIEEEEAGKKFLRIQSENNNCGSPCLQNDMVDHNSNDSFEINEVSPDIVVPKNLCDGFYDMTLNETIKENEEPLGSSTASNEVIESEISKESSKQQFLETNFDYVESEPEKLEDSKDKIEMIDRMKNILDYDVKNIPLFKILKEDPRSPSIGIDRTPIIVSKVGEDISDENVEDMSDDSLIQVLQTTNTEQENVEDKNPDGIHIYEDKVLTLNDTPKKSKSENNSGSRTPLSCMKNKADSGHARSKSTNTLYDSKCQKTKLPKRVSHIPRLKSLTQQSKYISSESSVSLKNISKAISGDCENTPPHSHRDRWDKDSSIVL